MEDIVAIKKNLKIILKIAKALVKNDNPFIYEIGHYLADNLLSKICLIVASEKGVKYLIYRDKRKIFTKDLKGLYNDILKKYYPKLPKYNEFIKKHHKFRNIYQHNMISLEFTIRQPQAENYVNYVENIMRKIGYITENEQINPSNLLNKTITFDYQEQQKKKEGKKYQEFYDLFKSRDLTDIRIKFNVAIKKIGFDKLKEILVIEGHYGKLFGLSLHNSLWNLYFWRDNISMNSIEMEKGYSVYEPDKNRDVLEKFLEYLRDCFKKHDIEIKL